MPPADLQVTMVISLVKYCTLKIFQSAFVKVFGVLFFLANVICIVEAFLAWAETAAGI
jgi:hypothetical protein